MHFLGWYDGDQSDRIPNQLSQCAASLPGDRAIEEVLKRHISAHYEQFGAHIGVPRMREVLRNLEGQEPHQWLKGFARQVGRDPEALLLGMLDFWLLDEVNLLAAQTSFAAFRSLALAQSGELDADTEEAARRIGEPLAVGEALPALPAGGNVGS